ncbi:MAG: HlyD family efflux transporter periplasmic adaptor subunit, partial [Clostridia bacterium]|nr:HlyD family efflux transporter periplasmic adaptor subunit [Clostridia bacterium]
DKTADTITAADFDQNSYHETDLKTEGQVKTGDDIYTIITDERWSLIIPLREKQAAKLADRTSIRVKFLKDDMTQSGDFSIMEIDGDKYGKIDFNRGLIRYAADRFLDIELVTNTITGLKIPLSSIVTKEFYTIPSTYATKDENSQVTGFMKVEKNKSGETVTTFVNATIYAGIETEESKKAASEKDKTYLYYVDKSNFKEGDAIIRTDTKEKYIVGETDSLEGVYCINQGYAVFRRIDILDQNEEYAIVSKETPYGLARYDHIVKDASKVKEEDILY